MNKYFSRLYLVLIALYQGIMEETGNLLDGKVDLQTYLDGLATKVNTSTYERGLAAKVNTSTYEQGLATKVDTSTYEQGLGTKVSTDTFNTALGTKVDTTTYTQDLAGKVDTTTYTDDMSAKANISYVEQKFQDSIEINRTNSSLFPFAITDNTQAANYGNNGISLATALSAKDAGTYEVKLSVFDGADRDQFDVVDFIGTAYENTKVGHLDIILVEKTVSGVSVLALYNDQQDTMITGFEQLKSAFANATELGAATKARIAAINFN